jgi:hypothetical protein
MRGNPTGTLTSVLFRRGRGRKKRLGGIVLILSHSSLGTNALALDTSHPCESSTSIFFTDDNQTCVNVH